MSQSPSCRRDSGSASPESPAEGDSSSRQLGDGRESLEETETCDDRVGITARDSPGLPLNAEIRANDLGKERSDVPLREQPVEKSRERGRRYSRASPIKKTHPVQLMEARALDGRFITLASAETQTDWEWVEWSLSISCQVQKEIEDPQSQADFSEESGDETIPWLRLPRLIAYKPESKQTLCPAKVPEVQSKQDWHLSHCDYCRQLCHPFIDGELVGNETDCERLFCCERAKQMRALILEVREQLALEELAIKIDVGPHAPVLSESERNDAKDKARERVKHLQFMKKPKKEKVKKKTSSVENKNKASYRLSIESTQKEQVDKTVIEVHDPHPKEVVQKFYSNGSCFLTLCPDGTGNVYYPSGKTAIVISSTEAADSSYIVMEEDDVPPYIRGIFTKKGHSTCYHPSGIIWLNLTPFGGLSFRESGKVSRRWNWQSYARNVPFKPMNLALGSHVSVHIHSQEEMHLNFTHQQRTLRFLLGTKYGVQGSHDKPCLDVLEKDVLQRGSEIYKLLGRMETCMSNEGF